MKCIQLTKGQVAIVDDEDFERLAQWRWYCSSSGYACRQVQNSGKTCQGKTRQKQLPMHSSILPPTVGFRADHINGNRLDNRRSNLRYVTLSQQCINRSHFGKLFEKKGISKHWSRGKHTGKYIARIQAEGVSKYLGLFNSVQEASDAYEKAALELHGEFRRN